MKLTIGVPVFNQHEETKNFLRLIQKNTKQIDEIVLIDNGSNPSLASQMGEFPLGFLDKIRIFRNPNNVGVRPALNQIWRLTKGDVIVYTHNDLEIFEEGWDEKIRNAFLAHPEAGIVGAYGAKVLGTADIYQTPYQLIQLARGGNVSNARMDKNVHGFRNLKNDFENVAVFDGMFMAVKRELLNKTEGFSDILPAHHNYDNLISIQSWENGYENILIGLDVNHKGGRTDVGENWTNEMNKTKQQIHEEAHPPLYEYGKGKLPIAVDDIYDETGEKIIGYQLYMNNQLVKSRVYE